ncbi:unnamed protein product [Blepharisma stoltei]|uniref:Uncharacterized protein n=1 Tax=Blepharisma stoltei TaxID=1481888 RepID=A0AAU9J5G1_9CILI|nr:unnamed protein product [Blepharisma stoltei]
MFDPSPHIEKFNFYDEVGIFIKHGDNLINMISQNKTYSNVEAKFFALNSFGYTFEFTQNAMQTLVDCEVSRAEEIGKHITSWIFAGLSILIIFMGILIGYVIYMNRNFDKFWNFIIKTSQSSYLDRRTTCIERLSRVHGIDYKQDSSIEYYRNKKFTRKVRSRIYVRYFWRLLIFLLVASSYYIILNFYLYDLCENSLVHRPKLLLSLISKRALLSRMSVFARDIPSKSSLRWMPMSYGLADSKLEFLSSNEGFKFANSEIRNKNFLKLLTSGMKRNIFEARHTNDYYLQQGTYAASNIMYIDAKFISTSTAGTSSVTQFAYYIGNETALQNVMGIDYDIIDHDSKNVIQRELNLIIYVTIIFSSALLMLFLFFYLPFIQNEKCQLKKLKALITIVPSGRTDSKSEKMI